MRKVVTVSGAVSFLSLGTMRANTNSSKRMAHPCLIYAVYAWSSGDLSTSVLLEVFFGLRIGECIFSSSLVSHESRLKIRVDERRNTLRILIVLMKSELEDVGTVE